MWSVFPSHPIPTPPTYLSKGLAEISSPYRGGPTYLFGAASSDARSDLPTYPSGPTGENDPPMPQGARILLSNSGTCNGNSGYEKYDTKKKGNGYIFSKMRQALRPPPCAQPRAEVPHRHRTGLHSSKVTRPTTDPRGVACYLGNYLRARSYQYQ